MIQSLRYTPDSEHRFFCYSPEFDGLTFWTTAEERDGYAADQIRTYLDDNVWYEDVENLFGGVVTHITKKTDILQPQGELDEGGYDQKGESLSQIARFGPCNYELQPLPAAPTDDELLGIDELRDAWNAQADAANSWDELGMDEILCFAQQQALARWGHPAVAAGAATRPALVRYGVCWEGIPSNQLLVPMDDGYWTPWHLAAAAPAQSSPAGALVNQIDTDLREAFRKSVRSGVNDPLPEQRQRQRVCGSAAGDAGSGGGAMTEDAPNRRAPMADISPAQKIVAAFNERHELCGPCDDDWIEQCLAAAFRAAADQVVPEDLRECETYANEANRLNLQSKRRQLLAIAAELKTTTNTL
jgi:hypothetical protein